MHKLNVFMTKDFPRYFLLVALVLVFVIFGILEPAFLNFNNLMNLCSTASVYAIASCGLMLVLCTGDLNLATGSTAGMAGAIVGAMMCFLPTTWYGYLIAILVAVVASALANLAAGFCNIQVGIPTFIATLAIRQILDGITAKLTGNVMFYSAQWGSSFSFLGTYRVFGVIQMPVIICIVCAIITYIFTERTVKGRHLYATGANVAAATQCGIRVRATKYLAFGLCGVFLAIAGIVWCSMMNSTYVSYGTSLTMPVLACTMLGATFITPGKYNVPGILVSAVLFVAISNGVQNTGAGTYVKDIVQGVILVVAVGFIAIIRPEGLPKVSFER